MRNFIIHYGVKGMKWGIRRRRSGGKASGDHAETRKLIKKGKIRLTNEEIQKVNKRLELEQKFDKRNPTPSAAAKRTTQKAVSNYSNFVVVGVAGAAAGATGAAAKKAFEKHKVAERVTKYVKKVKP